MGSVLETTTFSSQSATILVASLLLYVVIFDLNKKIIIVFVCVPDCQFKKKLRMFECFFTFSNIAMSQLLSLDLRVHLFRVVQ